MTRSSIHSEETHLGTVLAVVESYTLTHTTYSFRAQFLTLKVPKI